MCKVIEEFQYLAPEVRRSLIKCKAMDSQFAIIGHARARDTQKHHEAMLLRLEVGLCSLKVESFRAQVVLLNSNHVTLGQD